ncbi:MAG: cation acetate symporter, partial [Flavobacteriaceae bacterium]|nr:cation acetate symporter [Flavobacteriaceae bacterium]
IIGMAIVLVFAFLGGMKGITYTQVAQYCVLIFAFMVPAFFISMQMTGNIIPQIGMGGSVEGGEFLLDKLDKLHTQLGFNEYTSGTKSTWDVFAITLALMVGTAGLPHVIVRFFTVPKVKDARKSAGLALLFIAILYTTAPAIAVFARTNLIETVSNTEYKEVPQWFKNWEDTGLIAWSDKNGDGKIQYVAGNALDGKPKYTGEATDTSARGAFGERMVSNANAEENELYVDRDIMVLANPEIANLPNWVIALVAAGGLAAALSTAAGLLLVISTSISHDLIKKQIKPDISEKGELMAARIAILVAIIIAGLFGIYPPGFVAAVVALAFGLAAASFFPAIILGIFDKRMNRQGAVAGMIVGIVLMLYYMIVYKTGLIGVMDPRPSSEWWFGTSPEGFGTVAMLVNFVVSVVVSRLTPAPPQHVQEIVENIRIPSGAGEAQSH